MNYRSRSGWRSRNVEEKTWIDRRFFHFRSAVPGLLVRVLTWKAKTLLQI